jgi:hypothetical protein
MSENFSLFVTKGNKKIGYGPKFIKLDSQTGQPSFFGTPTIKIGKKEILRKKSIYFKDVIYEVYTKLNTKFIVQTGMDIYFVKRNTSDFKIIGEPTHLGEFGFDITNSLQFWVDETGITLYSGSTDKKKGLKPFVKKYDLNFTELWSTSISEFYPKGVFQGVVKKVQYDETLGKLLLHIDKAKCQDCGFFQRKVKVKTSEIGICVINSKGEKNTWVPEIPGDIVYSSSSYFMNKDGSVSGIYDTHESGLNEYKTVSGAGFLYCKWDGETGELINSNTHNFTYGDILNKEVKLFLGKTGQGQTKFDTDKYPRFLYSGIKHKLSNGKFVICYPSIKGKLEDNYNDSQIKRFGNFSYIVGISEQGQIEWSNSLQGFDVKGVITLPHNESDNITIISTIGNSANFPNNKFKFTSDVHQINLLNYQIIDLKTGESLAHNSFGKRELKTELTKTITHFNNKSNTIIIGIQSNSGAMGAGRKSKFTATKVEELN